MPVSKVPGYLRRIQESKMKHEIPNHILGKHDLLTKQRIKTVFDEFKLKFTLFTESIVREHGLEILNDVTLQTYVIALQPLLKRLRELDPESAVEAMKYIRNRLQLLTKREFPEPK